MSLYVFNLFILLYSISVFQYLNLNDDISSQRILIFGLVILGLLFLILWFTALRIFNSFCDHGHKPIVINKNLLPL